MKSAWLVYDMLLDIVPSHAMIKEVTLGLTWTLCQAQGQSGLAMSPQRGDNRTLSWPGTLKGKAARDVASWIRNWDPCAAAVGMAAINASLYPDEQLATRLAPIKHRSQPNLAVFDHFIDRLKGKKVVVVGRYPGLETALPDINLTVIELQPGENDLPAAAAEYILRDADWVFLTASSLTNKTFPRLAELASDSNLVLMGPTTPWITEFNEFGVDYLAGIRVRDEVALRQSVMEGGGTRIFESAVEYCVVDIAATEMSWIATAISDTVARREEIKSAMELWYANRGKGRFPLQSELVTLDAQLSSLDTQYKRLWDARH